MASDHVCFDVTRLLRSWLGADTVRMRQSIELFSELRPLSEKEKTLLQAVDAATVLLSPVTWFRRRFDQREQIVWSEEMSSRLAELADTVEHFEPV
jgi:hypothetical protein